jgi:acyl carrier protein
MTLMQKSLEMATTSARGPVAIDPSPDGSSAAGHDIETQIRNFVARELLFNDKGYPYADNVSFLQERVIDSLGVLELITFAGREFGVQVEPADVTPENFDSVERLAAYIRRKQSPTPEAR